MTTPVQADRNHKRGISQWQDKPLVRSHQKLARRATDNIQQKCASIYLVHILSIRPANCNRQFFAKDLKTVTSFQIDVFSALYLPARKKSAQTFVKHEDVDRQEKYQRNGDGPMEDQNKGDMIQDHPEQAGGKGNDNGRQ